MQFVAKALYVRCSPFKLRPVVDVIRGKKVQFALNWLNTCALKKVVPIKKVVESAVANAKNLQNIELEQLVIKEIRVDQGPVFRYFKPGAQGRANLYKRRLSHMKVILESIDTKEA